MKETDWRRETSVLKTEGASGIVREAQCGLDDGFRPFLTDSGGPPTHEITRKGSDN